MMKKTLLFRQFLVVDLLVGNFLSLRVSFRLFQKGGGNAWLYVSDPKAVIGHGRWSYRVFFRHATGWVQKPATRVELYGCFRKWVFPPNHPFVHRVFNYFHHPFWGTPIFGNTHISRMK